MTHLHAVLRRCAILAAAAGFGLAAAADAGAGVPIRPEGMMNTVRQLSGPEMKGRGIGTPELDKAAAAIAFSFESLGLQAAGTAAGSWYQDWTDPQLNVRLRNIVGLLPGRNPELAGQYIVIGAHYDHLGTAPDAAAAANRGKVHPGADDNASGVAVLLELASRLPLLPNMERSIVFVAFSGEEAGRRGSRHFVDSGLFPASKMLCMINLDTVGRLDRKQLVLLGAGSAREWGQIFRETAKGENVDIAESMPVLDSGDHMSFIEAGVPAVQLFTGPHADYHTPSDTADRIDADGLVKVAAIVRSVAFYLATTPAPLTPLVKPRQASAPSAQGERRVTIGIVPDYTWNGSGVRLGGTAPGGPAEQAGLREGDVIAAVNGKPVAGLKDLSDMLRTFSAGERIKVTVRRDGKDRKIPVKVQQK